MIDTGTGADDIFVGAGQATIAFQTSDINSNSVDTIHNLITAQDGHANPTVIDLSQILESTSYTPGVSNINNFVEIKEAANGTQATLEVDTTGQGNFTTPLAIIKDISHGDIITVFDGNYHQKVATE